MAGEIGLLKVIFWVHSLPHPASGLHEFPLDVAAVTDPDVLDNLPSASLCFTGPVYASSYDVLPHLVPSCPVVCFLAVLWAVVDASFLVPSSVKTNGLNQPYSYYFYTGQNAVHVHVTWKLCSTSSCLRANQAITSVERMWAGVGKTTTCHFLLAWLLPNLWLFPKLWQRCFKEALLPFYLIWFGFALLSFAFPSERGELSTSSSTTSLLLLLLWHDQGWFHLGLGFP